MEESYLIKSLIFFVLIYDLDHSIFALDPTIFVLPRFGFDVPESPALLPRLFYETNLLPILSMILVAYFLLFLCTTTCCRWFCSFRLLVFLLNYVRSHRFSYHLQGSLVLDSRSLIPSSFVLSLILLVTISWIYCPVNHIQSGLSARGEERGGGSIIASWGE